MATSTSHHRATPRRAALAVVGGLLWLPYGVLELLQPWGQDVRYDESLGYSIVLDRQLFTLYSLPGALAVLLCAFALLALQQREGVVSRTARATAAAAAGLGAVSVFGVVLAFDPAFTGGRIVGTLLLGGGALLTAAGVGAPWRAGLVALGTATVLLLSLWPLVFAVGWLSPAAGAAALALHGAGWVAVGAAASGPTSGTHGLSVGQRRTGIRGLTARRPVAVFLLQRILGAALCAETDRACRSVVSLEVR